MNGWKDWTKVLAALLFTALGLGVGYYAAHTEDAGGGGGGHGHGHSHGGGSGDPADDTHDVHLSEPMLRNLGVTDRWVEATSFTRTRRIAATVTLPPEARRPLFAPIGGRVENVDTLVGQIRKAGEPLVTLLRDPIPRPALRFTRDVLQPAQEERHHALVELRRTSGELRIAKAELERVESFDNPDDPVPVVPRQRAIELRYALERAQMAFDHAQHELHRHGLSDEQIAVVLKEGHMPPISGSGWQRALEHNGLWPLHAQALLYKVPEADRDDPWIVATIGELAAQGLINAQCMQLFDHPNPARHFVDIGVLLQQGHSPADVASFLAHDALDDVVRVRAPQDADDWDVVSIAVRPGAHVARGDALAELRNPRRVWLEIEPIGDEVGLLTEALRTGATCRAAPLVEGDGPALEDVRVSFLRENPRGTVGVAEVTNRILESAAEPGTRSWALRSGQRYELEIPIETIENVIVLPVGAIAEDGGRTVVFVYDGHEYEPQEVTVTFRDARVALIPTTGPGSLAPDTKVVDSGALALQLALLGDQGGGGHHHHH